MPEVTTDIQGLPTRRLSKKFTGATKAIGTSAPNTFNTNQPSLANAMGVTPPSGILSFIHDGATQDITVHVWHAGRNRMAASKGWVQVAESAALASKNVQTDGIASLKVAPGIPFFLQAGTSDINNCWVNGREHEANPNTDTTNGA